MIIIILTFSTDTAFQCTSLFCLFSVSGKSFLCGPYNHCASRHILPLLRARDTCGMAHNSIPSNLETYNLPDQIKVKRNKGDGKAPRVCSVTVDVGKKPLRYSEDCTNLSILTAFLRSSTISMCLQHYWCIYNML